MLLISLHAAQNDMFDLMLDLRTSPERFVHMSPGERYKSWELVWNEFDTVCHSHHQPYDPCRELRLLV